MIDIDLIRTDTDSVAANLAKRGIDRTTIDELAALDQSWRTLTEETEALRARQNQANEKIAAAPDSERQPLIYDMKQVAASLKTKEADLKNVAEQRDAAWRQLPNLVADDVPEGPDESGNQVLREVGEKPAFDFDPKPHWELGAALDIIDTERASAVTGSRFSYLKNELALLQFALIQLALNTLTNQSKLGAIISEAGLSVAPKPFSPIIPPVFIRPDVLDRMARLEPKEDRYYLESDDLYLVGSAEHTLGPLHMDQTLSAEDLPIRYVGYSTAFRREAGSHGKDVRGILRQHQFDKLEMESFTIPDQSIDEQNFFTAIQEHLMQQLAIPYRVVQICTGDMGDPDARQVDIEAWLPSENQYRETHTADLMTDYQARRLNTKVKIGDGKVYVHMNDATVFAIGRTLIALIENHQQSDGSVAIPKALHPYLPFTEINTK